MDDESAYMDVLPDEYTPDNFTHRYSEDSDTIWYVSGHYGQEY